MSVQLRTTVLAVRQSRKLSGIFASAEPAPAGSSLDGANRRVAEDNLCRFIWHFARLGKRWGVVHSEDARCALLLLLTGTSRQSLPVGERRKTSALRLGQQITLGADLFLSLPSRTLFGTT